VGVYNDIAKATSCIKFLKTTYIVVGFEVLMAIVLNVAVFCSQYVNRRFRGTYRLHAQDRKSVEQ
jgi:hypothetical protein